MKSKNHSFYKIIFYMFFWGTTISTGFAYQITWEDLMEKVLKPTNQNQFIITTSVKIFQPSLEAQKLDPIEIAAYSFKQKIYWKLGELLVVETFDEENKLLHFYYENNGEVISKASQKERYFNNDDIMPHYLRFIVQRPKDWGNALEEMNIQGEDISFYLSENSKIYHRIGNVESNNFLLLSQKGFIVKSLQFVLFIEDQEHIIRILFNKITEKGGVNHPEQTDYLLDNQLFKRVTINTIDQPKQIPLERLRQKALTWSQPPLISFQINFTK